MIHRFLPDTLRDIVAHRGERMPCPHASGCEMFAQFKLQSMLRIWQIKYCEGDYARCVRYQTAASGQPVAPSLLPNGGLLKPRVAGR